MSNNSRRIAQMTSQCLNQHLNITNHHKKLPKNSQSNNWNTGINTGNSTTTTIITINIITATIIIISCTATTTIRKGSRSPQTTTTTTTMTKNNNNNNNNNKQCLYVSQPQVHQQQHRTAQKPTPMPPLSSTNIPDSTAGRTTVPDQRHHKPHPQHSHQHIQYYCHQHQNQGHPSCRYYAING